MLCTEAMLVLMNRDLDHACVATRTEKISHKEGSGTQVIRPPTWESCARQYFQPTCLISAEPDKLGEISKLCPTVRTLKQEQAYKSVL